MTLKQLDKELEKIIDKYGKRGILDYGGKEKQASCCWLAGCDMYHIRKFIHKAIKQTRKDVIEEMKEFIKGFQREGNDVGCGDSSCPCGKVFYSEKEKIINECIDNITEAIDEQLLSNIKQEEK